VRNGTEKRKKGEKEGKLSNSVIPTRAPGEERGGGEKKGGGGTARVSIATCVTKKGREREGKTEVFQRGRKRVNFRWVPFAQKEKKGEKGGEGGGLRGMSRSRLNLHARRGKEREEIRWQKSWPCWMRKKGGGEKIPLIPE